MASNRRPTSAGYRMPLARIKSAPPRAAPIPERAPPRAAETSTGAGAAAAGSEINAVDVDSKWRERVGREKMMREKWKVHWGFMADYDPQGNFKEKPKIPENLSVYSETVPNTRGSEVGSRLESAQAQYMGRLQRLWSAPTKKRKLGSEMVCW